MIITTDNRLNSWPPKSIHSAQQIDKMLTEKKNLVTKNVLVSVLNR